MSTKLHIFYQFHNVINTIIQNIFMNPTDFLFIHKKLYKWYDENKRILPWRDISDPYKIWISEIILQQTRVAQGFEYFIRFIERFENVESLGAADENEVLKYWQGLGYYSRARNLHKAARIITTEHKGVFPNQYNEIISLPGIGEYTAAAIASFAFKLPFAVVDGNVYRVLSRLFNIEIPMDSKDGKKIFKETAQNFLNVKKPDLHNQAIMELGALQCVPVNPDCEICPLKTECSAFVVGSVNNLPVKERKTATRNRYFNYFFIQNDDKFYIQKRTKKDIWKNLYELPLIETEKQLPFIELIETEDYKHLFDGIKQIEISPHSFNLKHILSHQTIYATFYHLKIENENNALKKMILTSHFSFQGYPISRLTELFFEQLNNGI